MKRNKSIIISSKPGRLGNMLFLFSYLIAFGIEKGIAIDAPAFEEHADYFGSTCKALIPAYPKGKIRGSSKWLRNLFYYISSVLAKIIFKLNVNNRQFSSVSIDWNEYLDLENEASQKLFKSRYTFVQGWEFRTTTLIKKHKEAIINFFKPTGSHIANVNKLLSPAYEVIVGVHIRQGDYKVFEGGKYFFEIRQYIDCMRNMSALIKDKKLLFLICSDSNLKQEVFSGMPCIFGTGVEIEDLYAFSKCNFLIGPPSTFTMWASFYGNVPLYQVHDPESGFTLEDFKVVQG